MVENPSTNEAVSTVAKPGGEPRETAVDGGGGEEQIEHTKEPPGMGAARVRNDVDRNGANAAAIVRAVRGNGKRVWV